MGIRVNDHETLTLDIGGADLTVPTDALFKAWMDKHIVESSGTIKSAAIPAPRPGERYVGSITEPNGRTRHVFLLPGEAKKNWQDGMAWAKEQGGDLPDRIEQAMLYAHMPEEFKKEAYWSNTQHADYSSCAWCQGFFGGSQSFDYKYYELLVRAVRREFSDSVI